MLQGACLHKQTAVWRDIARHAFPKRRGFPPNLHFEVIAEAKKKTRGLFLPKCATTIQKGQTLAGNKAKANLGLVFPKTTLPNSTAYHHSTRIVLHTTS